MGTTKIEALVEDMKDFMRANTHLVNSVDANGFIQSGRWTARFFWKKHDYCQSVDKTTRDAVERIVLETLPEIFPEKYSMLSSTEKIRWIELLEDMTKVLSQNPNEAKKNCIESMILFLKNNAAKIRDPNSGETWPLDSCMDDFWRKYDPNYFFDLSTRGEINWVIRQRWPDIFPEEYEMLSSEEGEKIAAFVRKNSNELTDEIVEFFKEKRNWPALLDRSVQGRRNDALEKFWLERYPELRKFSQLASHIQSDARHMAIPKLPSLEKQVYENILSSILEWAEENGKSPNFEALRQFLKKEGLEDSPSRFQKELLADFKNATR